MSLKRSRERTNDLGHKTPRHAGDSGPRHSGATLPPRIHASKSLNQDIEKKAHRLRKNGLDSLCVSKSDLEKLKGLVIEVEGNIGSGKSTMTGMLKNWIDSKMGEEQVSCFGEKVNNAFLKAFYSNPKRFSFAFQMYMLTTRLYQMDESYRQARHEQKLCFLDRGAVGDTLFALLNRQLGSMEHDEMEIYRSVCKERLPASISDQVDMLVYLDVDPNECHRRMTMLRKRDSESGVPLSYLEAVDSCYFNLLMDWLGNRKGTFHEMNIGAIPPMLVIRWDKFGNVENVVARMLSLVCGARSSPQVSFQLRQPSASLTLNTSDEIASAFRLITAGQSPRPTMSASPPPLPDLDMESVPCDKACVSPSSPSHSLSDAEPESEDVSSPVSSKRPRSNESELREKKQASEIANNSIAINWDLPHNNDFKRVVMYYLSECASIIFYGDGVVVDAAKPPQAVS